MVIVTAREQGFPGEHLCENTSDRPYVDRLVTRDEDTVSTDCSEARRSAYLRILLERQHDLWCSVPPG